MKTNALSQFLLPATLAAVAALFAGCGTTSGYKQADKTGAGIAEYRAEVVRVKLAVDDALSSLDQIQLTASTNPRKAYERFTTSVKNLDKVAAKAQARGAEMKAQGQAYFAQWEQQLSQVKNQEIRKLAEERRAKLLEAFDGIKAIAEPLKSQFDPWLSDLKDLQNYLGNDLTIAGVDAAKKLFVKARSDGAEVEKSIDALMTELNSIAATLTPANLPPTPPEKPPTGSSSGS